MAMLSNFILTQLSPEFDRKYDSSFWNRMGNIAVSFQFDLVYVILPSEFDDSSLWNRMGNMAV
jgi:hypothetical protein